MTVRVSCADCPPHTATVVRLALGALLAGWSMLVALGVNLTPAEELSAASRQTIQTGVLAATVAVMALLGGPLLRTALAEVRRGRITIEALFVLTLTGALAASLQALLTGVGPIYFEVVAVLLVVYTFGKLVGARGRERALASARGWASALATCRVVGAGGRT